MTVDSADAPTPADAASRLLADRPAFHGYGAMHWDVSRGTLDLLVDLARPGLRSAEVGLGVSTVVLAAAGGTHDAVGPARHEFDRIAEYCALIGVDLSRTTFHHGPSDRVLPGLDGSFDLVLIDGAHAFGYPVVDFHFLSRLLTVGGILVLDDLPIPSVQGLYRFLLSEPHWQRVALVDDRAAAFRLSAPLPAGDPWQEQPINDSYPDYSFLPWQRRLLRQARRRAARSARLRDLVTRYRARRGTRRG